MKAKYAIKALIVIAGGGSKVQNRVIAERASAPVKFLETILTDLKNHGVLESRRGKQGGYFLKKPADEIMIGDIIRLFDGPLAPVRCASVYFYEPCKDCPDTQGCAIRQTMRKVRDAMSAVLDKTSLTHLIKKEEHDVFQEII